MASNEEEAPQQTITGSARARLQGMWSSLRSINVDGDDTDSKPSMLEKWTSRTVSSDEVNNGGGGGTALENVVRSMFGSCALGEHDAVESVQESTSVRRRDRSNSGSRSRRRESSSASARAQRAVHNLRQKAEQRETSPSQRKASTARPFPASTPNKKPVRHQVPYLVHEVGPPPPPPNAPDLGAATFDDGISAISAHTLEELERQEKLRKPHRFATVQSDLTEEQGFEQPHKTVSNESSLFPLTTQVEGEERDCITSPIDFERERSDNTFGSRRTFKSMSTESTDFEKVWRQEEQKYWQEAVEQDEQKLSTPRKGSVRHFNAMVNSRDMRTRSRSREQEMMHLKLDGTNTTAGSSAFSAMSTSPQHSHPHDTIPLDPSDFVPVSIRSPRRVMQDPDRIQEFMAIDAHTEIGEI